MAEEAKADTSSQENKQENTPPAGQDTSAQTNQGGEAKTPETVTLTKEQYDEMQRNLATGKSAQKTLDRYQRVFGKDLKKPHFTSEPAGSAQENNEGTPPATSKEDAGIVEDRKAERLLTAIALDPKYREVLDADPTLRTMLGHNPLGVLPILAPEALDAEDANQLVREKLDERVLELKNKTSGAPSNLPKEGETPSTENTPPTGAVNTTTADVDAEIEAAKKIPNTEHAIAGMIRGSLKKTAKK